MTDATTRRTRRWRGVVAVTLLALGLGVGLRRPPLLLASVVGVVYATYPTLTSDPDPELALDRTLDESAPGPGDEVAVTVSLTNVGDETLFDCRVVDGVPPTLSVTDGSPRRGGVLRPGHSLEFSYRVAAERGTHRFDPATVVVRDPSGDREVECRVATETELDCTATAAAAPLRRQTLQQVGQILSNRSGAGVEFHRTREYRRGDPMSRIDWNRYASSGEFTTVEFRREQAASVVVLVDARAAAYRGRDDDPHAVAYGVSAARQFVASLTGTRNRVGLAAFGRSLAWVAPGVGGDHADDIQRTLATDETFGPTPPADEPDHATQVDRLRERLTDGTQLLLVSPLCDDAIVQTCKTLDVAGYGVSVVTPTVTEADSPGRRLAALERRTRLSTLRDAEIPVVEWHPDDPLAAAISRDPRRVTA
ncbi:DUF58 domain-containing protein [Halobacteriales archaeon Cl-PHB]